MTIEQVTQRVDEPPSPGDAAVDDGRRRVLKGSVFTAPVLLTLPSMAVAQDSSQLQLIEKVSLTAEEAKSLASSYLAVQRPIFRIENKNDSSEVLDVVNRDLGTPTPDCAASDAWVDLATLGNRPGGGQVFTATSCVNSPPGQLAIGEELYDSVVNKTYKVTGANGVQSLVIGFDASGTPISIGRAEGTVYLSTESSWASVAPNIMLPQ